MPSLPALPGPCPRPPSFSPCPTSHFPQENPEALAAGATYTDLETLLKESDVVSLHVPLLPSTLHIINKERWVHARMCAASMHACVHACLCARIWG